MRSCAAAIIHAGSKQRLIDAEGREHKMLNQNVLIEIGAAMALYGRKFILLVEKEMNLPSNLQGLCTSTEGADLLRALNHAIRLTSQHGPRALYVATAATMLFLQQWCSHKEPPL